HGISSCLVLPVHSVGVQGDARTYRQAVVLFSSDRVPHEEHWRLATEIPNTHPDFNRVLLCTSHAEPVAFSVTPTRITRENANLLRAADTLVEEEVFRSGLYDDIWQFPVVLLPLGVEAGQRSIVLRPVASQEAMTADAFHLPSPFLLDVTQRLL
ncbi:MAG: hypothetical protein AAB737_01045, partial [Patescibacteria group bacterium]